MADSTSAFTGVISVKIQFELGNKPSWNANPDFVPRALHIMLNLPN